MKRAFALATFKFDADIKQPLVLRPTQVPLGYRLILGTLKAISKIPTSFLRAKLSLDCNERIVEVPFALQNVGSPAGMRILDFGCVESILSIILASQGAEVIGVDLRDYEFEHPNFLFHKGDFMENTFPDAYFDAVVAISAIEHCGLSAYGSGKYERGDVKVIEEFSRVLRPAGILILTVPFGNRYMDDRLRIYDSQQLENLTDGFWILKRQFYRKSPNGTYWLECSQEEGANAGQDPVTGVEGVALLVCKKTAEQHVPVRKAK